MAFSKSQTRILAGLAGILFLLCQSAALAAARVNVVMQVDGRAAVESPLDRSDGACHGAGGQACHGGCETLTATPDSSVPGVLSETDLPIVASRVGRPGASDAPARYAALQPRSRASPSLSILHCCLRN